MALAFPINMAFTWASLATSRSPAKESRLSPRLFIPIFVPILAASAAHAEENDSLKMSSQPPERISFLATFGEEECPPNEGDEIVVCANAPEGDRYRIPKKLRQQEEPDMAGGSWSSAVENLDEYARVERPNSCSVVGSNGFTGCTQAMLREWFAARRSKLPASQ